MIGFVPVSIFEHKPEYCSFGHKLWPGRAQVSWKPCVCAAALEGAERGRGMGHVWVSCRTCHDQLRQTTFYEPPHDIRHRQACPCRSVLNKSHFAMINFTNPQVRSLLLDRKRGYSAAS